MLEIVLIATRNTLFSLIHRYTAAGEKVCKSVVEGNVNLIAGEENLSQESESDGR